VNEAIATYRTLLEKSDGDVAALNALAVNLYRSGEVEEPELLLRQALAEQPFFPHAHLNLAVIEHDRGDFEASLRLTDRALKLRPNYLRALELRAMNLEAMGDEAAAQAWQVVHDRARDNATRERCQAAFDRLGVPQPS
jgi:tetratricopeptide (TPR) repeat protein